MPHVTSIGLDVHARSVAAAAFNPFTGEVVHRDFGTGAAEIAEWALGFEEPRACYESGPTGFHMARELRALGLDCAVAAVSKMQRPAADARRKNDRRDAESIARTLATHNIVEVPLPDAAVEAARDLDRALDDATRELRRARQRLNMFLIGLGHVWDERNAGGITKTGNRLARTALVKSAWHYLTCAPRPKAPAPGADVPTATRARADDCTARLCRRREALAAAGKSAFLASRVRPSSNGSSRAGAMSGMRS